MFILFIFFIVLLEVVIPLLFFNIYFIPECLQKHKKMKIFRFCFFPTPPQKVYCSHRSGWGLTITWKRYEQNNRKKEKLTQRENIWTKLTESKQLYWLIIYKRIIYCIRFWWHLNYGYKQHGYLRLWFLYVLLHVKYCIQQQLREWETDFFFLFVAKHIIYIDNLLNLNSTLYYWIKLVPLTSMLS